MRDYIEERATQLAYYIIEHKATVRQTAKVFNVSKSTAHKDVTARLMEINPELAREARKVPCPCSSRSGTGMSAVPERLSCISLSVYSVP